MRLGVAAVGIVAIGVVAALAVQRLNEAERFRRLVETGEQALAAGNTYTAIEAFSGAMTLRDDSMVSHLRRGEAYRAQRRFAEAGRDFREAARLQPGAIDPLLALADLHDMQGDTAAAADWLGRAAAIDRQSPTLLYRLALARYRSGQPGAALDPLRQAVALNAGFDEALYLLGLALRDTQDVAGAAEALELAVRANPALTPAREELADLYRSQGRSADEMAQLTALASQDARLAREIDIALAQARRGEFDAADATLDAADRGSPTRAEAETSLLHLTRGRIRVARAEAAAQPAHRIAWATSAIDALERALGGSIRRSDGLAWFGRALHLKGDISEAVRILRDAVATTPFHRRAFLYLADALEDQGAHAEARQWLLRFDALEGDAVPPGVRTARQRRLAALSLAAGDVADAAARLAPLLAAAPDDVELLAWSADARWQIGDREGALAALAHALALAPRDTALRRLQQRLR